MNERVALVTGASRGIGRATATRLAESGHHLVLHSHRAESIAEVAAELAGKYGVDRRQSPRRHRRPGTAKAFMQLAFQTSSGWTRWWSTPARTRPGMLGMTDDATIQRLFAVNSAGAAYTLRGAARLLARGRTPAVVLVSSITASARHRRPGRLRRVESRGGGLARSAAKELGPQGIRVNAVEPGFIATDMLDTLDEKGREQRIADTALRSARRGRRGGRRDRVPPLRAGPVRDRPGARGGRRT